MPSILARVSSSDSTSESPASSSPLCDSQIEEVYHDLICGLRFNVMENVYQ